MIPHMPSPLSPGKTGSHLPRRSSTPFPLCEAVQKTPQTGKPPAAALSWTQSWQAFSSFVPSPGPAPALSRRRSPAATPKLFLSFHSYLSVSPPSFRHYASFYVHAAPFGTHACYSMLQHCPSPAGYSRIFPLIPSPKSISSPFQIGTPLPGPTSRRE